MTEVGDALDALGARLEPFGWVRDVLVGGSLATGDHRVGVSDLDLVAVVDGPMTGDRVAAVRALHAGAAGARASRRRPDPVSAPARARQRRDRVARRRADDPERERGTG